MALFLITILGIWAAMHSYVFWRLSSIPWVSSHVSALALAAGGLVLWSSYLVARVLDSKGMQAVSWPIEYVAANWIGVLFLLFFALLAVDLITLGGNLFSSRVASVRGWAVLLACALSIAGWVQGLRAPVLRDYEVTLHCLPAERDGTVLVQVSDLHLGNLLGRRWLLKLVARVQQLRPDIIVLVGDVVDGNVGRVEPLREVLATFKAPLGVWAVTGNHEYYAGADRSVQLFQAAGFHVLRDASQEAAPGLIIAGVDDLTARQQFGSTDHPLQKALRGRPSGATILLSHSPLQAKEAAGSGVGLMLSGHTHNGQLWPFNYLVARRYPLIAGSYEVDGMTAIVCRGTGTWGPRMRLWRPSEIVRIRLKSPEKTSMADGEP
ncbi:MAG TPA: metallophosphoesterase [Terriglobales bacterium]|nr:metallophosphoesterase [Terriglobales bacterium]